MNANGEHALNVWRNKKEDEQQKIHHQILFYDFQTTKN